MTEQRFDAVVFDAYRTLLDVHAAMARHAKHLAAIERDDKFCLLLISPLHDAKITVVDITILFSTCMALSPGP